MDYTFETLLVERQGPVLHVTLNRPERLNAFSPELRVDLGRVLEQLTADDAVKVAVLTGAGRAFCAGGDVSRMAAGEEDLVGKWVATLRGVRRAVLNLLECEKPIVAKINGPAVGAGCTLALACDVTFIADTARIGDPHVSRGLVAGAGGSALIPHLVGYHRARELMMTGELVPGPRAAEIGLVNHCVPAADLDARVAAFADQLAAQPERALQWTKRAINSGLIAAVGLNMDMSVPLEAMSMATEDHREAARAFKEKRRPLLTGR